MKKSLVLLSAGAALFAAGYYVRDLAGGSGGPTTKSSPLTAVIQEQATPVTVVSESQKGKPPGDAAPRPFTPGRPFAKGHAREWLLSLTSAMGGDRRGNGIAMASNLQAFLTMDDDSVRETLAALEALIALADAENPDRRRNPNGDGKLDSLLELSLMRLVRSKPEEALAILGKNFNLNDGSTRLLVLGTLAASDPQRAERLALTMEKGQQREALESVLYGLINKDPQAALDMAARHPEIAADKSRERILESWVKRDPGAAMSAAVTANNTELIRNTIEEWAKSDPAAASRWADTYHGPGFVAARATALERRAREEPQAVLQEYMALQQAGGAPAELGRLTSALADALAGKDINAAREWGETLPEGDLRNRALHRVAEAWIKRDAPAASEWIRSLPPGQVRDHAAMNLSTSIARRDPSGALEWSRSIENGLLRQDTMHNVMQVWREVDPDAAKAAMESLPVTARPQ